MGSQCSTLTLECGLHCACLAWQLLPLSGERNPPKWVIQSSLHLGLVFNDVTVVFDSNDQRVGNGTSVGFWSSPLEYQKQQWGLEGDSRQLVQNSSRSSHSENNQNHKALCKMFSQTVI